MMKLVNIVDLKSTALWLPGSSPGGGTNFGLVAQWLERATHNRLVGGSNPSGATTNNK